MAPNHGQISALVALITDASKIVEQHYAKSATPAVPSLDDTESHPLDGEMIYDKELRNAIRIIEGAFNFRPLSRDLPIHWLISQRFMGVYEPVCLNVALTFEFADIIQEKPAGMHISEISQKSGVEVRKIGRVLRMLASKHVFKEVSDNVFANNRLSIQLLCSNPLSSLGLHLTDESTKSAVLLSDVLADKEWGPSYAPHQTAFNKYSDFPEPMFKYFEGETPRGAELGARFGVGMIGWGAATEASSVIKEFPWNELSHGASVCDVGGGVGNITLQLAKVYPTLDLKLQDLPKVILQAKNEVWPKKCPEAIAEKRIQFEPIDFLSESPIQGCDVYYLKNIIHNWPDADCIKILTGVRKAMVPHSRVLLNDYILQHANRVPEEQSNFTQAPEPLLPNYGAGRIRQYNLDVDMMCILNSEERQLDHFIKLGEAAGLKFERLWDSGEMGLVEYRLPA